MVKRIGHGANWRRGVEQLHVDGLVGLAIAVAAAVDAFEGAIVTQRESIRGREKQRTYPDMRQVGATYILEKQLKVEWDSAV